MPRLHALIPLAHYMQCRADAIPAGTRRPSSRRRLPARRRRRVGALFKRAPLYCLHLPTAPLHWKRHTPSKSLATAAQLACGPPQPPPPPPRCTPAGRTGGQVWASEWQGHLVNTCVPQLSPGAITLRPQADQLTEGMPSSVMAAVTWAASASMCSAVMPLPTVQAAGSGPLYCPPPNAAASQSSCGQGVEQCVGALLCVHCFSPRCHAS